MSGLPKCDCGSFMRWVVMVDGRRIPLDIAPSTEKGTVWVDPDGKGRFLSKEQQARAREKGVELWVQHHATCANVGRHRVRRSQMSLDLFGSES